MSCFAPRMLNGRIHVLKEKNIRKGARQSIIKYIEQTLLDTTLLTRSVHSYLGTDNSQKSGSDHSAIQQTTTCYLMEIIVKTNVMFFVSKLTMVDMKLSFMTTDRMLFQVSPFSPRRVQMDSSAILTTEGGLAIDLTSTNCCFLIERTAVVWKSLPI